jgi:hypothetical protein
MYRSACAFHLRITNLDRLRHRADSDHCDKSELTAVTQGLLRGTNSAPPQAYEFTNAVIGIPRMELLCVGTGISSHSENPKNTD